MSTPETNLLDRLREDPRRAPEKRCREEPDLQQASANKAGEPSGLPITQQVEQLAETSGHAGIVDWSRPVAPATAPVESADDRPDIPGYEILGILGRGGMGIVYRARQIRLNRTVALKMILSGDQPGSEATRRFLREAEAVARLRHGGIVQIHELGLHRGRPFFSLEFCEGGSLRDRLDGSPLPARLAASLVETMARAVGHAHAHGVIHRDLKPDNVLIDSPPGTPLEACHLEVGDFGLAREVAVETETQSGAILGTPCYMAPEQAAGRANAAGPPADVYALGVVLYELLTGRVPFRGATLMDTLAQVLADDPVPPRRLARKVPRDLETICLKCLRKEPARRYPTATDLADDLRRFLDGESIRARPTAWWEHAMKWSRRHPAVSVLMVSTVALLLTLLLVWGGLRRQAHDEAARQQVNTLEAASVGAVPTILAGLTPYRGTALPILRQHFEENADPRLLRTRLRLACGLTKLGEPPTAFLLRAVGEAPASPDECMALLAALRIACDAQPSVMHDLRGLWRDESEPTRRARLSIVLLHLGDADPATSDLSLASDPSRRTTFIHFFSRWHGPLDTLCAVAERVAHPSFRSGLAVALAMLDPELIPADALHAVRGMLERWYHSDPDGGVHSAAGCALERWGLPLPELPREAAASSGCGWFVNRTGMTMLAIPRGRFLQGDGSPDSLMGFHPHPVVLTRPYFLSDREVTVELFERFQNDATCPPEDRPSPRAVADKRLLKGVRSPMNSVNWHDAVLFCNWLSRREGRTPCYVRIGPAQRDTVPLTKLEHVWHYWHCRFEADGYRLPTEAEWEHACRAGTTSKYSFGDDEALLPMYGEYSSNYLKPTSPAGRRLPNAWGLFDMHGNVWEMCWDWDDYIQPGRTLTDPAGPLGPLLPGDWMVRVLRGGGVANSSGDWRSSARGTTPSHHLHRSFNVGFRVACGARLGQPLKPLSTAAIARLGGTITLNRNTVLSRQGDRVRVEASSCLEGRPEAARRVLAGNPEQPWYSADSAALGDQPWLRLSWPADETVHRVSVMGGRSAADRGAGQGHGILTAGLVLLDARGKVLRTVRGKGTLPWLDHDWYFDPPVRGVRTVEIRSVQDEGDANLLGCIAIGAVRIDGPASAGK